MKLFLPKKTNDFEKWLDKHGYYYLKTENDQPCFKSKLTQKLNNKFKLERNSIPGKRKTTKLRNYYANFKLDTTIK